MTTTTEVSDNKWCVSRQRELESLYSALVEASCGAEDASQLAVRLWDLGHRADVSGSIWCLEPIRFRVWADVPEFGRGCYCVPCELEEAVEIATQLRVSGRANVRIMPQVSTERRS